MTNAFKGHDPYREALELYQTTVHDLDTNIARAMRALFDYGDIHRISDRKVFVCYGLRIASERQDMTWVGIKGNGHNGTIELW